MTVLLTPRPVRLVDARRIWIHAQGLAQPAAFGAGPAATRAAIEHLGYVQIDTINVIERAHHHILFSRIPAYRRDDLRQAQSIDKSAFEYWTHALSYIPTRDLRYFVGAMKKHRRAPISWFADVEPAEVRRIVGRIRKHGPLSIRDVDDDVLVEKNHAWASRKPSKRALQRGFFDGHLMVSERTGMLKTYDLLARHFGSPLPAAATEKQSIEYLLDRALRSQGIVSLDSIHHTHARYRPLLRALIDGRVRRQQLLPVVVDGAGKTEHWAAPAVFESKLAATELTHILSPFDPLIIQRQRLKQFFGYEHLFEAYVPKEKRKLGYFALPVLVGDEIVAALDLKADRNAGKLLIQAWHWLAPARRRTHKRLIEQELHRFSVFQFET